MVPSGAGGGHDASANAQQQMAGSKAKPGTPLQMYSITLGQNVIAESPSMRGSRTGCWLAITQQPFTSDPSGFKEPVVLVLHRPPGLNPGVDIDPARFEYFVRVELFICGWKEAKRTRCGSSATSEFDVGLAPKEIRCPHLKGTLMQRVQIDGTVFFDDLRITLTTAKMRKHASVGTLRISSANYCLGFQLVSRGEVILREMVLTKPISVVHRTTIWRSTNSRAQLCGSLFSDKSESSSSRGPENFDAGTERRRLTDGSEKQPAQPSANAALDAPNPSHARNSAGSGGPAPQLQQPQPGPGPGMPQTQHHSQQVHSSPSPSSLHPTSLPRRGCTMLPDHAVVYVCMHRVYPHETLRAISAHRSASLSPPNSSRCFRCMPRCLCCRHRM